MFRVFPCYRGLGFIGFRVCRVHGLGFRLFLHRACRMQIGLRVQGNFSQVWVRFSP